MHSFPARLIAICTLLLTACSGDSLDPPATLVPTLGDSAFTLNTLRAAAGAPIVANPVVSFWAKVGEDREAFMYYQKRPTRPDSTVLLRFRVSDDGLLARPGGAPFAPGDSILITITLSDPARLIFSFAPAGLLFSPTDPAELELNFLETDDDLNGDGDVDDRDAATKLLLAIWRRETSSSPWVRQTSLLTSGSDEIETDVFGFTDYVIAW